MSDYTIQEFCRKHDACSEGYQWAIKNCQSMEDAWNSAPAGYLVWIATCRGVLTRKELRLFAVFCCHEIRHLMEDQGKSAIEVVERFAHGNAIRSELSATRAAAWKASDEANSIAANEVAREAAKAAAWTASAALAAEAAREAANAETAAWITTWQAAWGVARSKQAEWLRANCKPNFKKGE